MKSLVVIEGLDIPAGPSEVLVRTLPHNVIPFSSDQDKWMASVDKRIKASQESFLKTSILWLPLRKARDLFYVNVPCRVVNINLPVERHLSR